MNSTVKKMTTFFSTKLIYPKKKKKNTKPKTLQEKKQKTKPTSKISLKNQALKIKK